jgi:predicted TIM-barrel fold metal-dependent hydrolase
MTIDGYCTLGEDREYDLTEASLLEAMDATGVEKAVIVPPDRNLAVYNREGNDSVLRAAQKHRARFIPACSVNPWYGPPAVEEFRRALGEGARMLVLHPYVQGFAASDELIFPLLDESAVQKVSVYIHTGPPGNSTPWQITELADRYPQVDFIMGHCGATDFWNDVVNATAAAANIYLESSLARPFQFARYLNAVGKLRGIVGSWAPLNNLRFEWDQMRKYIPPEMFGSISGENLAGLVTKRGPL